MHYYAVTFDRPDSALNLCAFDKKLTSVLERLGFHKRADTYWIGVSPKSIEELYDAFDKALPYVCKEAGSTANNLVVTQVIAVKERYKPVGIEALERYPYRSISVGCGVFLFRRVTYLWLVQSGGF